MTDRDSKKLFFLLGIVALTLNLLVIFLWDTAYLANDAIQYISTARNWLAGNGFSTDTLMYSPHFQGVLPAAQTVWPPGYPLAVALFSKIGLDLPQAAFALNLILHALASCLLWRILRKLEISNTFAVVSAFMFYLLAMPWFFASAAITEPLFTTLLLSALLLLPDIRRNNLSTWFFCGLIIAASIYVRYSTVLFAIGVGAGLFIYILIFEYKSPQHVIKNCSKLVFLIALPVLAFLHLMYRTNTLIGTLDRYSGSKEPETFGTTIYLWLAKSSELIGFTSSTLLPGDLAKILFVLLTLIATSIAIIFFVKVRSGYKDNHSEESRRYLYRFSLVALAHAIALVVFLTIQSMSDTPLDVINRYIYQIYPGLYILFCFMLHAVLKHGRARSGFSKQFAPVLTGTLMAIYLVAQVNALISLHKEFFSESQGAEEMMALTVTSDQNLVEYIVACFEENTSSKAIWSTHGQRLHFHTKLPTLSHASIYTNQPFDGQTLATQIDEYALDMFVFVNYPGRYGDQYTKYMQDVKSWLEDTGYSKVSMLNNEFTEGRSVEVYTTATNCGI